MLPRPARLCRPRRSPRPAHPRKPRLLDVGRRIPARDRFAPDSPLEGTGFEPSVPRQEKWSMPSSSDQTRVGRTLTLGGGAESSLEVRDIELSVSPKDIGTSPYDLRANRSDRRQSREGDRWFESTSLQRGVMSEPQTIRAQDGRGGRPAGVSRPKPLTELALDRMRQPGKLHTPCGSS